MEDFNEFNHRWDIDSVAKSLSRQHRQAFHELCGAALVGRLSLHTLKSGGLMLFDDYAWDDPGVAWAFSEFKDETDRICVVALEKRMVAIIL